MIGAKRVAVLGGRGRTFYTDFSSMTGLTNLLGTMAVSGGYAQGSALAADGHEIIVNSGFDTSAAWLGLTGNWSIAGGVGVGTAVEGVALIYQAPTVILGATYTEQFTLVSRVSGTTTPRGVGGYWGGKTVPNTYSTTQVAAATNSSLGVGGSATFTGTIDDFSVQLTYAIAYHEFAADATIDWGAIMPAGTTPRWCPFRISDGINQWGVRILPGTAGTDTYLIERNAGVETTRASADVDWSVSNTDEVRVVARGTTITVYHRKSGESAWTEACSYGSATFNQTATKHGVAAYDTGANLFSYLRMVA